MPVLSLEIIGENYDVPLFGIRRHKPWVAEITGVDGKYGMARTFLRGPRDYSAANSVGSRGVYRHYCLSEGKYYQVQETRSWRAVERYYCTVRKGAIVRVNSEEIAAWLDRLWESGD